MVLRIILFYFQNCLEGTNSTSCSAMVEEQKDVVGTCLQTSFHHLLSMKPDGDGEWLEEISLETNARLYE